MLSVAPSVISLDPHPCWPSITSSQRDAGLVLVLVGMPGSSGSYSSSDPSSLLESDWPDSPESPESIDAKRLNAVCFFWTCGEQGIFRFGWPRCPEDASWPVHSRRRGNTARKGCRSWPLTSGPAWRLSYLTEVLPQVRRLLGQLQRHQPRVPQRVDVVDGERSEDEGPCRGVEIGCGSSSAGGAAAAAGSAWCRPPAPAVRSHCCVGNRRAKPLRGRWTCCAANFCNYG
jgi:hypothetical protein